MMHGTLEKLEDLKSDFFEVPTVEVWLPEDYDAIKEHPVIYMLDGQWLFDPALTWANQAWEVDKSMTKLIKSRKIPPAIVVAIWHHETTRNTDYLPCKVFENLPFDFRNALTGNDAFEVKSDDLLKFIVKELKPEIDKRFLTSKKIEHTLVVGSSMGALFAVYAVCEYPEVFGRAGCLSPHWCLVLDGGENPAPTAFIDYLQNHLPKPAKHRFYFDIGTGFYDNRNLPFQPKIDAVFREKDYAEKNYCSKVFEGHNHSEKFWVERFPGVLSFLLS